MSDLQTDCHLKLIPKGGLIYSRQVVNTRHQTPQGQLVTKPEIPPLNIQIEKINLTLRSPMVTCSMQYSKRKSRVRNIPGGERLQNQNKTIKNNDAVIGIVVCYVFDIRITGILASQHSLEKMTSIKHRNCVR